MMVGPYELNQVYNGHCLELLKQLPDNSIHSCITSPPYFGLRSYGTNPVAWPAVSFSPMAGLPEMTIPEQVASLGNEADLWAYVGHLVVIFREVKRALRDDGVLWLNLGSSYSSGIIKSDDYVLRDDLTPEERAYIYEELAKIEKEKSEAVS